MTVQQAIDEAQDLHRSRVHARLSILRNGSKACPDWFHEMMELEDHVVGSTIYHACALEDLRRELNDAGWRHRNP